MTALTQQSVCGGPGGTYCKIQWSGSLPCTPSSNPEVWNSQRELDPIVKVLYLSYISLKEFKPTFRSFPGGSDSKESACNAGDESSIPGSGRFPWRRAWLPTPAFLPGEFLRQRSLVRLQTMGLQRVRHDWAANTFTFTWQHLKIHYISHQKLALPVSSENPEISRNTPEVLEKEMATHSSVLSWRIPGTEEPGLPSVGWHRVGHDCAT